MRRVLEGPEGLEVLAPIRQVALAASVGMDLAVVLEVPEELVERELTVQAVLAGLEGLVLTVLRPAILARPEPRAIQVIQVMTVKMEPTEATEATEPTEATEATEATVPTVLTEPMVSMELTE
jgi:hypothetical protein